MLPDSNGRGGNSNAVKLKSAAQGEILEVKSSFPHGIILAIRTMMVGKLTYKQPCLRSISYVIRPETPRQSLKLTFVLEGL